MLRKSVFTIGEYPKAYIGFTEGKLWNGWATPAFEKAEAIKVAEGFNETAEFPMQYDEVYDQFYILDTETKELEKWEGNDVPTPEGIKHLYGIGAYSWVWDEEEIKPIAKRIADFFLDYEYEIAEGFVAEQLKDVSKLRVAIEILRADEDAGNKMQKFRKELTIIEIGQLVAVNGILHEYVDFNERFKMHILSIVEIDEEGNLIATHNTWAFKTEELKNSEVHFTEKQWCGIVKILINDQYVLAEEGIDNAVNDIVCREFAILGEPTLEELYQRIEAYMDR